MIKTMIEHEHIWKIDYSQPTFDVVGVDRHVACECGATAIRRGTTGEICDIGDAKTTPLGQYLLRRQAASLHYVGLSVYEPPIGCEHSAFLAGWDAAVEEIGRMLQTPGGDGCYCAHHPDDPAHMATCYDLVDYLTRYR